MLKMMDKKELNVVEKKELEIMELDNVSGGSWWNDLKNIVEDTYELVKDIT
jgi:hypothetical protein